ncbi:MAG: LuxR C-terminal-related transcriptional regulator [Prochlorococcaceae cyanobacterium]
MASDDLQVTRVENGIQLRIPPDEMARIGVLANLLGLNELEDDSVGAVLKRPVRFALLDASLLNRQFWLMLSVLAPGWDMVAVAPTLDDLVAQLSAPDAPGADVVIADPTGLCSRCVVSCLGDAESCPLLGQRKALEQLPPVLLYLREGDIRLACQALAMGVRGFQLHRRGMMGLRDAVLAVVQGAIWIDPDLSADFTQVLQREAIARGSSDLEAEVRLSDRERDVLLALEKGQRLVDVATSLVVSENTVKTHLRRIYEKLGVDNRYDAVSRARLTGQL